MSIQSDIAEIRAALVEHEQNLKTVRRSARKLHNLLATKLGDNAELLGLSEGEVVAFGGGTDKPPEED